MVSALYLFGITVLLLAALAVTVPVLLGIVREGRERRRKWNAGEIERYTEDEEYDAGPPAALDRDTTDTTTDSHLCPHCGTENDVAFTYCQECTKPL